MEKKTSCLILSMIAFLFCFN
ncbi:MAG: hypothetical protein H6Q13_2854, partial [Bacteroidetes bacterium]|nr:hypothetical protein [Bacteroidota bacterium]